MKSSISINLSFEYHYEWITTLFCIFYLTDSNGFEILLN